MTYNVHSCIGLDGRLSPRRIARVLAALDPDIVALQELDVGRVRSGGVDQARLIAEELSMDCQFHPCLEFASEKYGNAILSRLPMEIVRADRLPTAIPGTEPRGALWTRITHEGQTIQLITTHLGLHPRDRDRQIDALLGPDWLSRPDLSDAIIVCGDFNAGPRSSVYRKLSRVLKDACLQSDHAPQRTWFSPYPLARIDHVFVSRDVAVSRIRTDGSRLASVASDHRPVIVDFALQEALPETASCNTATASVGE